MATAKRMRRVEVTEVLPGGTPFRVTGWVAQWLFSHTPELFPVMLKAGEERKPADKTRDYWYRKADRPFLAAKGGDHTMGGIIHDPNRGRAFDDTNLFDRNVFPTREAAEAHLRKLVEGRVARLTRELGENLGREFKA